mgnify:CR=1 FL=1
MSKQYLEEMDFYLVTDTGLSRAGTEADVRSAVDAGCRVVQYREKSAETRVMVEEAARLRDICRGRALFVVNDRIDVALAVGADGVHIGQDDMPYSIARRLMGPDAIIGVTVHDVRESVEAERMGADYLGLSPIFETATKEDAGAGCGTAMVRAVRDATAIPIVAIGGLNRDNTAGVIESGAHAAVAISAVVCAEDVCAETRAFIELIRAARGD